MGWRNEPKPNHGTEKLEIGVEGKLYIGFKQEGVQEKGTNTNPVGTLFLNKIRESQPLGKIVVGIPFTHPLKNHQVLANS